MKEKFIFNVFNQIKWTAARRLITKTEQNIFETKFLSVNLQGELPACDREREEADGTWWAGGASKGCVWLADSLSTIVYIWNNILHHNYSGPSILHVPVNISSSREKWIFCSDLFSFQFICLLFSSSNTESSLIQWLWLYGLLYRIIKTVIKVRKVKHVY